MGRRKDANPRRNASALETEQLGARMVDEDNGIRLPGTVEQVNQIDKVETKLPPLNKRRRIDTSDEDEDAVVLPLHVSVPEDMEVSVESTLTIESAAACNGKSVWTIRVVHSSSEEEYSSFNSEWTLRGYRLFRTRLLSSDGNEVNAWSVQTSDAAATLLKHCESMCLSGTFKDVSVVAEAVGDGTLRLDCCRSRQDDNSVEVFISLTEKAFDECSTDRLPLNRRTSSKKYQVASRMHWALAQLFPDSVIADTATPQRASAITAKKVYDLIDNTKLQEYEANGGYGLKPMSIPGLLPTLRPYQEAAVKWMLQREKSPIRDNNEWELAWVILAELQQQNQDAVDSSIYDGSTIKSREVVSLPEWKRRTQSSEVTSGVLFCPFAGFLVTSGVDAYLSTLNSFLESGDGSEWANETGGILGESMGLGKTVEVLACVLANRHPCTTAPTRIGRSPSDEEEKKECNDETRISSATSGATPSRAGLVQVNKWIDDFGPCVCGSSSSYRGCLSTVLCQSCGEPLHGLCAGFSSVEDLRAGTNEEIVGQYAVRVCSGARCPTCVFTRQQETNRLIESRATLIVTPPAILSQWEREIRRHTGFQLEQASTVEGSPVRTITTTQGLKVLVYLGVKELCNRKNKATGNAVGDFSSDVPFIHLIHPQLLADADIVLMTFDTLMTDLGHSDDNPYISTDRRLRTEKRYRVLPSPLTGIKWWRVCLDEAQRVETPTAASAKMALKLTAHHRWCVSGTPISRGKLDDLYGLFSFLKVGPFSSKVWFQKCLQPGHRGVDGRIRHLLSSLIWRSTKTSTSVARQIGVPEQIEKKVILKFSSIERHFYERQLESTLDVATDVMKKTRRTKHSDDLLAAHIHQLRAACCHPQVGSRGIVRSRKATRSHAGGTGSSASVSSSVLTMDQILDRLIDDARVKCEEAQRLAVMHTNALASMERLKVEAKKYGTIADQSDESYLTKSSQLYLESLELTNSNAQPSPIVGEAILSGCSGFLTGNQIVRDGKARLQWTIREESGFGGEHGEVWSRFDFEGPAKKVTEIRVRPIAHLSKVGSDDRHDAILLMPKECIFQVSSAAVGGEFVDVVSFSFPPIGSTVEDDYDWLSFGSFHTNRSKSWRFVVKSFHPCCKEHPPGDVDVFFVGIDVQLMEPDFASDSLQRLHVLHNASLSMSLLLENNETTKEGTQRATGSPSPFMSEADFKEKVVWMQDECRKIQSLYMDAARHVHDESQRQLQHVMKVRKEAESELQSVSPKLRSRTDAPVDFFDDGWWNDVLTIVYLYGTPHERNLLCDQVRRDLGDFIDTLEGATCSHRSFPDFQDADGIQAGLSLRFQQSSRSHAAIMQKVTSLPSNPSDGEVANNVHCHKCRADWNQTGPECNHCKLETELNELDARDPVVIVVLSSLHRWLRETRSSGRLYSQRRSMKVDQRAEIFFKVLKASERELRVARLAWRTHFDLLSDVDELNQCKRSIRLVSENEDLTALTQDELGSIVTPRDIPARCMDHAAKQAMALATLRRNKDTLRYLKNQSKERAQEMNRQDETSGDNSSSESNVCVVCLSPFEGERAVLSCGHSFHQSPCLERLITRAGNHHMISCPLRCTTRTRRDDVMIASEKRRDDGSRPNRKLLGSWGTKVTRLLSDVMDVSDRAEKSIVFSQWEDMLDVVEEALKANGVTYVRPKTLRKIGDSVKVFRSSQCTVLLLNVKNGAEGLTLVEANHCFMIEPLLNCGLDSQAINRIHRIGQQSRTCVHRYLIQDTIEENIDKMRMDSQNDQLEDALNSRKKKHDVSAGGIDGGFSHEQLQAILTL